MTTTHLWATEKLVVKNRYRQTGRTMMNRVLSALQFGRSKTEAAPEAAEPPHRDPFADHPIQCKCTFHR